MRLGVMGGTFDPIHNGHLVAAEAARHRFGLERVLFVPSGQPPHKRDRQVTDGWLRYVMCVLATVSHPAFEVSDLELQRPGPTYTRDTLRVLRAGLGPDDELYFITGADAIHEILAWKNPEEVVRLATLVAVTRPAYGVDQLTGLVASQPLLHNRVQIVEIPGLAISSSDLRQRIREGRPVRYLLPEAVEAFIGKHRLYAAGTDGL